MLKIKGYVCLVLAVVLCFSLSACGKKNKSADTFTVKASGETGVTSGEVSDTSVFFDNLKRGKLTKISGTDMASLYFNEKKGSISVYDSGADKIWHSLPETYKNERTGVISLNVLADGKEYVLYSQSESQITTQTESDGIRINYAFSAESEKGTEMKFTVPVKFTCKDGILTVSVNCGEIETLSKSKKAVLKSLSILPFFGAYSKSGDGDYLVIPDGCGALVDTSSESKKTETLSVSVYSADPSQNEIEESFAVMPIFGIKKGSGAIAAVINEGAEISAVKAHKATEKEGFNRVYPEFEITPTAKNGKKSSFVSQAQYKGAVSVSYRFLSKDSADYIGIAAACRELLIREGALTEGNIEKGEYPFNLSLIGSGVVTDEKGKSTDKVLCSYLHSYDILETLKAKDINNINLRYKGILDGGLSQKDIEKASFSSAPGTGSEKKEFADFAHKSGTTVYTDVSLFSADVKSGFKDYAVGLDGENAVSVKTPFNDVQYELSAVGSISAKTQAMLSEMRKSDFDGICLYDAGSVLYSDFSSGEVSFRTDTAEIVKNETGAVSASKKLMIDGGNLYAVKYASVITGLPEKAFYSDKKYVKEIPLVQSILHGILDYSMAPVNKSNDPVYAFLRCAEYGAVPYYEWYYADFSTEEKADKYYYMNSLSDAQINYERMKNAFGDLRTERITDHEEVKKNVFVTEYSGNTRIYVNYNSKAVTVHGVTVDAKSFLRVN